MEAARTHPEPFSPVIEHAIELSSQWHDRTYRKGGWREASFELVDEEVFHVPVMAHVTAVALAVARAGWDEETIAAAFLHDVLEDEDRHGRRFGGDRLRHALGDRVTDLVEWVTERQVDDHGRVRDWRARKEDYLARLSKAPVDAVAISVADKLHNLWSIDQALGRGIDVFVPSRGRRPLTAGPDQQLWFQRSVWAVAASHDEPRLVPLLRQFEDEIGVFECLAVNRQT